TAPAPGTRGGAGRSTADRAWNTAGKRPCHRRSPLIRGAGGDTGEVRRGVGARARYQPRPIVECPCSPSLWQARFTSLSPAVSLVRQLVIPEADSSPKWVLS